MVTRVGINVLRLLPTETNKGPVPVESQAKLGDALLANHQCITLANESLLGGCLGMGGKVVGGVRVTDDCPSYYPFFGECYEATNADEAPTFVSTYNFTKFKWQNSAPGVEEITIVPGSPATLLEAEATGVQPEDLERVQALREITISDKPASIAALTVPPLTVQVGVPFIMKAEVRISSGALLRNAKVTVELAPAKGTVMSAIDFIKQQFGIVDPVVSDDPPKLDSETVHATTDEYGIARFAIVIDRGPPMTERKLIFKSGVVHSKRTRMITIINPISSTTPAQNITYKRKGLDAIGSLWTERVKIQGLPPESFPVLVSLPDTEVQIVSATRAGRTVQPSFAASALELRTFTTADLDKMRQKARDAVGVMGALTAQFNVSDVQLAAGRRMSESDALLFSGGRLLADDGGSSAAALQEYELPANISGAFADFAQENGANLISQFIKLLMSGTNPLTASPEGTSKKAEVWSEDDIWVNDLGVASFVPGFSATAVHEAGSGVNTANGTIRVMITNLKLVVRAPGTYVLQPVVAGIAGTFIGGTIEIDKFSKANAASIALDYAFRLGATAAVASMALGASDFHRAKVFVPLSLAVALALAVVLLLEEGPISYPIGEYYEIGTWWVIVLCVIAWGTLSGALGVVFGPMYPALKPFAQKRRESYFAYVRALLRSPRTEAGKLAHELKMREQDASFTLNERMALEKRISVARTKESSYIATFKALVRSNFNSQADAFFFPQRLLGAFAISVFGVIFMGLGVQRWLESFKATLDTVDSRSSQALYSMNRAVQDKFLALTGQDLEASATEWIFDNAEKLRDRIYSLGEATSSGVYASMGIAYVVFVGVWFVMLCEFRQQVLAARRGSWSFDWRNTPTALVVTFIGTAISNGLIVFVASVVFVTPIVVPFAWIVTREYLGAILGTNVEFWVIMVAVPGFHLLIKFCARYIFFVDRHTLRFRYAFMFYDLYETLMTCVAGLMRQVSRAVMTMLITLVSLPRLDVSPFPAWVEYYFLLDTGSKSFQGLILLYHWHNHPVMRVAAWIMQEDAYERRHGSTLVSPKLRRVSNRWNKLWMMTKNPELAKYSSRRGVDMMVELVEGGDGHGKTKAAMSSSLFGGSKANVTPFRRRVSFRYRPSRPPRGSAPP
jgi:hypothetical protein